MQIIHCLNIVCLYLRMCVCVPVSGGGAGPEQEVDEHRLPAEEVGAEQEAPGDHQQEAAGLCAGTSAAGPLKRKYTPARESLFLLIE